MNNKKLANLIKQIRKTRMEQKIEPYKGGGADIQDPASPNRFPGSSSKEIHHGLVREFQTRARQTQNYIGTKLETGRESYRNVASRPLGSLQSNRYSLGEEGTKNSNTKSTVINTTPEQDSAMVGTQ